MVYLKASILTTIVAASLALASPPWFGERDGTSSAVSCTDLVPVGWKSNRGRISFYDNGSNNNFNPTNLPANGTAAFNRQFVLADDGNLGAAFFFETCNFAQLNLTTNRTQSSCSEGTCYHTYYNYVRVKSFDQGRNCLTVHDRTNAASTLSFQQCKSNPKGRAQIFLTSQQVLYNYDYSKVLDIGDIDFENTQDFDNIPTDDGSGFPGPITGPLYAWYLKPEDNTAVQTIHYMYTQAGLGASLYEA